MLRCPTCSHESAPGARFCPQCAAPLLDSTSLETTVMPATRAPAATPSSRSVPNLSATSTVDEGRFLPGAILAGRYRVAGLLGKGGMGEVYRATDLVLGQAVALKFLPEAASSDDRALARFYNEVKTARQVTHQNVCRVYDIGEAEGLHYISMEYVDGEDLSVLLRRIGRLPADKAIEISRKLCAGLAAAHDKGVLHRDLKPANVMIDGRGEVVIMDFGLAGLVEQLQGDVRSGTPAYMSPEQLAGTEVTPRSDVYSLGLLLYELFTGKRAFEASSLMELMQMQERANPASLTTLVHELDPAVERIVLRCLSPDPRQRPASALAVAAALPGGDALAAALAAGETPSPELLAAAGETEGLHPKIALACLAAALVGIFAVAGLSAKFSMLDRIPLDIPPDGLMSGARTMLAGFGYAGKPADSAWGFEYTGGYVAWLAKHPSAAALRWKDPARGAPPFIRFWYIQSPYAIRAVREFNTVIRYDDPPLDTSGMVRMRTDPRGRLLQLEAVPPQREAPAATPAVPFDWQQLFRAAGLDQSQFHAVEPQWTPLANWDTRAAWEGRDAYTDQPQRIEASAWRGKPVSFRIIGPWNTPERMQGSGSGQNNSQIFVLFVVYLAITAAGVIAWYNHRTGRVDGRGAWKLAGIYAAGIGLGRLLESHHIASTDELSVFWRCVSIAILNASILWIFYLALEPWVRRRWPQTMIAWSRFTTQGIRDPLVGRDLLFGCGLGAILALLLIVRFWGPINPGAPLTPELGLLMGVRITVADTLEAISNALFSPLTYFFLLFFCRVVFRNQWLSAAVFLAITTVMFSSSARSLPEYGMALLIAAFYLIVLMRLGMFAVIIAHAISEFLSAVPFTTDLSSWYVGAGLACIALMSLLAVYACKISLGGRKLLSENLF
jgi:serine/threonine-protein kinase